MKTKTIVLLVLIVILAGGTIFFFKGNTGPRIQSFVVETPDIGQPSFVATSNSLDKIEVWGVPESASSNGNVLLGSMELVEKDKSGESTWILPVPEKQLPLKEVFAQGYISGKEKANKISLPQKGVANVSATLWPSTATPIITGTVKSITARALSITIPPATTTALTINITATTTVVTAQGQKTSLAKVKVGNKVNVSGIFADEIHFVASQIELAN